MNIKEQIEHKARVLYPILTGGWPEGYSRNEIEGIKQQSFIKGANFALEMDMWVKVEDGLPEVSAEFNESDYVLCVDRTNMPFSAWYNSNTKRWYYAHYIASGVPVPTHWQPLPKLPR